jgi:hypothetical protein
LVAHVVHSAVLLQTSQFELQASQLSGAYFPNLSLHVVHSFPSTHTLQLAGHAVHRSAAKYSGIGVVQSHKSVQALQLASQIQQSSFIKW